MGRSGYTEDLDPRDLALYRGRVTNAISGQRGQRLLRDLRDALDAMPEKRLIRKFIVDEDGERCALGCVGKARAIPDIDAIDPEDHAALASRLDVAKCLIAEIEFENDDDFGCRRSETPEQRYQRIRAWVDRHIKREVPA